jgi:hypothetical protein
MQKNAKAQRRRILVAVIHATHLLVEATRICIACGAARSPKPNQLPAGSSCTVEHLIHGVYGHGLTMLAAQHASNRLHGPITQDDTGSGCRDIPGTCSLAVATRRMEKLRCLALERFMAKEQASRRHAVL